MTPDRPLNFLHVTTFYPPFSFGGDAGYVYRLAGALADAGHHVDVLHSIDAYRVLHPADPEVEWKPQARVTVHGLRSRSKWLTTLTAQQTGRPYLQQREILAVMNSRAYDVIHFHNISLFGPGILALAPDGPAPLRVYTTHEYWLVCPMHVLWKFNERPCEGPDCLACTLKGKRPPQLWRYTDYLHRAIAHVDVFVAPSRFAAAKHAERGFDRPFHVLPLFVDEDDDRPGAPSPHPRPYVLFVGRLERLKGVETLIRASADVPEVDIVIVGSGSEGARLRAMAASNPRIRFFGQTPQEMIGSLYAHALASCVPSLTYEVFPTVAIESLAQRTPVIAHDIGGLTEIVQDSGGGILYKTEGELIAALRRIAADPLASRAMGERGYCVFRERWSKAVHVRDYLGLLDAAGQRRKESALQPKDRRA